MKKALQYIIGSPPITTLARFISEDSPLVVLYHGVTANENPSGSENYRWKHIPAKAFKRQVQWLKNNFKILPLADIEAMVLGTKPVEKNVCAITFDDGYENNYTQAFPILKQEGIPATIFLATDFINNQNPLWPDVLEYAINASKVDSVIIVWPNEQKKYSIKNKEEKIKSDNEIREKLKKLPDNERSQILQSLVKQTGADLKNVIKNFPDHRPLSWSMIQEMNHNDITFGAHTVHHPILSRLNHEEQKKEITKSIEQIKSRLERCDQFAYPNGQLGDWNEDTEEVLGSSSIKSGWTTISSRININKHAVYELPRITLDASHLNNRFKALVSNALPIIKKSLDPNG